MALSKIDAVNFLTGTIPSGNIATSSLAAAATGKVLQVVQAEMNSNISTTANSYVDTGLNANITPSSTSNKILIMVTHPYVRKTGDNVVNLRLVRESTSIYENIGNYDTADSQQITDTVSFSYLDSPNSSSQINYKTQYKSSSGFINNSTDYPSKIILMEIAG